MADGLKNVALYIISSCQSSATFDIVKNAAGALYKQLYDDASSPQLVACVPPGFRYVENARPRKDNLSMTTNHGGVCLLYEPSLRARHVQLPVFSTFEVVAAYVHRAGFNAVVVVVYREGSYVVILSFFDEFSDLLQRLIRSRHDDRRRFQHPHRRPDRYPCR